MIIYPNIEIQNRQCVNLLKGKMDEPIVFHQTPLEAAQSFAAQGAEYLHIVDLDGAATHQNRNTDVILNIIQSVDIPVQVGGGIRSLYDIEWWLDQGVARVVVGTATVQSPAMVRSAALSYPEKILLSIDVRAGSVVIDGWTVATSFSALELAKSFDGDGFAGIILTDIDLDDEIPESSLALTTEIASGVDLPIISSGTIKTLDNIATLSYLPNIAGVITGRALFNRTFSLKEALNVTQEAMNQNLMTS